MKSKLSFILIWLIVLFLLCKDLHSQTSVPNTTTFSLQDVVNVTGGTSLTTAFANATGTFDPAYVGSKNSLLNFRNYKGCTLPSGLVEGSLWWYISNIGNFTASEATTRQAILDNHNPPYASFMGSILYFVPPLIVGRHVYASVSFSPNCDVIADGYYLIDDTSTSAKIYHLVNNVITQIL